MTSIWQHTHDACLACYKEAQEITRLRAEQERDRSVQTQEIARLREALTINAAMLARQCDLAREAEALATKRRAALKQYGQHHFECELYDSPRVHGHDEYGFTTERPRTTDDPPAICTCGLAAALAEEP